MGGNHGSDAAARPGAQLGLSRRDFLWRSGALGAAVALAGPTAFARAAGPASPLIDDIAGPAMRMLARDTISAVAVLSVPGRDRYSRAQGMTSKTDGPVEAGTVDAILGGLDNFYPVPESFAHELAAGFTTVVSDSPLPAGVLDALPGASELGAARLDQALAAFLRNDEAVPLSLLVSLTLNFEASRVHPPAVAGPIPGSPFASLSVQHKGQVFELLERGDSDLVEKIDGALSQPATKTVSGLVRYIAGTLIEFAGFTGYSEFGVFDRERRRATKRPVGWENSKYMAGRTTPADGWDELKGYYQGRRSVPTAPQYERGRN